MAEDAAALVRELDSGNAAARSKAAGALSRLGEGAQPVAAEIVAKLGNPDDESFELLVATLEDLGPPRTTDAPALAKLLGNSSQNVAYWAATLLGRLGSDAASATSALQKALESHPEVVVRQQAALALGKIGPGAMGAAASLKKASTDGDARLARNATQALQQIGG